MAIFKRKPKEEKPKTIQTNNKSEDNEYFSTFEVVVIVLIAILFGFIIGNVISFTKDRTITTKVPVELEEMIDTYNNIVDNYYGKLDKEELVNSGIKGLVDYLDDPYSMYMDESSTDAFNETVNGKYTGIGATVTQKDGKTLVLELSDDSSAKKAGVKVNDQLIEVDGTNVENKSLNDIAGLIRGKAGTKLKVTLLRGEEKIKVTIVRTDIEITSVTSEVIKYNNKKIGYIKVDTFAANTYKQFKKELESLESKKIDSLILDVRDNLGGHLNQVSKITSMFLEKGKVIYQLEEKGKKTAYKDKTKEKRKYKVAVLCNEASASAAELLVAAFNESYKNSVSIGVNTYGKGTVQKAYELSSGASLKYTTEKWLTPKGNWINEKGVEPDLIIEETEEYKENPVRNNDIQFQSALVELTKE